jgi:GNAT superfamily N-acetyltransferase
MEELIAEGARSYPRVVFDWVSFDRNRFLTLQTQTAPPDGSAVRRIDADLHGRLVASEWSRDAVGNFSGAADFLERAFGYVVELDGRIVSVAGCFTCYSDGIDVQIDTHPDYRRRGFARAAATALIAEAIERGIEVHWDAMNDSSAALARQLGYVGSRTYECLEVDRLS